MELFKIFGTLALKGKDEFDEGIDDSSEKAEKSAVKIGGVATKIGAVVSAAVAAGGAAIGAVTKNAIENYAEYEQLVGGVETLFKDSADTVMQYAENAYKTAGLSANEYMETVTSFSASLLQSLGGDTAKAAEMADLAITDMADNANKMGTEMESIQNAYQGFAKQNYTMLDNLKLGYGGTKEEMQRLIDDANALNAAQGKLTDYSIDSYADIVSAIHDVQTEMGITGTTAAEAASTIQGSISSAKAAWQNWLTALGDSNADIEDNTNELIESIEVAAKNLLPVFEQVLSSLGQALGTKLPELLSQAVSFVISHLPDVLALGWQLVLALIDGLGQGFKQLMGMVSEWANSAIVEPIRNKIEDFKTAIKDGFEAPKNTVMSMKKWFVEKIAQPIANFYSKWIAPVVNKIIEISKKLVEIVIALFVGLYNLIKSNIVDPIVKTAKELFDKVSKFASDTWSSIKKTFEPVVSFFENIWAKVYNSVKNTFSSIAKFFSEIWNSIKNSFSKLGTSIGNAISGAVQSAINGVISMIQDRINRAIDLINGAIGIINNLPGVNVDKIKTLSLPRLATGGVLKKGQVGLLEGSGAEAVVPLEQNTGWINGIAERLNALQGNAPVNSDAVLAKLDAILDAILNMGNFEEAIDGAALKINSREFARLVKGVN